MHTIHVVIVDVGHAREVAVLLGRAQLAPGLLVPALEVGDRMSLVCGVGLAHDVTMLQVDAELRAACKRVRQRVVAR